MIFSSKLVIWIFHPNLGYGCFIQNLEYDFSSKSRVWMFHQNLEYDFSSKSRVWIDHQNLEYDFSSKSRV